MVTWLNANPYRVVHEVNADGTEYVMRVRHDGGGPPRAWGLAIGEALFNFRGALDHALYDLAIAHSGTNPPPHDRDLQFPITEDPAKFKSAVKRGRLGELGSNDVVRNAVGALQPYGRLGEDGKVLGLWFLLHLNNADKHRTLQVVISRITSGGFEIIPPTDPTIRLTGGQQFSMDWHPGPLEDGTPLFRWTSDLPFFPQTLKVKQGLTLTPCVEHEAEAEGNVDNVGCAWMLRRVRDATEEALRVVEALG